MGNANVKTTQEENVQVRERDESYANKGKVLSVGLSLISFISSIFAPCSSCSRHEERSS